MHTDYREALNEAYYERRLRNPSYSLRAFARDLGIPASNLSCVLKKKKGLAATTAQQVARRLGYSESEQKTFCMLVEKEHSRSEYTRHKASQELEKKQKLHSNLTADAMAVMSHWHYFGILELLRIPFISQSPAALGAALELKEDEIKDAIQRMINLGLVEIKQNRFQVVHDFNWSTDGVPSEALRKVHDQLLTKAKQALFSQPVDERDFTYMMMTLDQQDLPEARKMIRSFIKTFTEKFSEKATSDHVYSLTMQLFNLTPGIDKDPKKIRGNV